MVKIPEVIQNREVVIIDYLKVVLQGDILHNCIEDAIPRLREVIL